MVGGTQQRIVALITARGGSKSLPRKNLMPLAGRPLIAYTIEAALESRLVSRVVVSTEDAEIAAVSSGLGAEVIDRPAALAQDASSSIEVTRHALEVLAAGGETAEIFALLQPTSPLRSAAHLDDCLAGFLAAPAAGSCISVTEEPHPPFKDFRLVNGFLEPLFDAAMLSAPRQTLPRAYRPNGAIFVFRRAEFLRLGSFFCAPALPFLMSADVSIDVDTAGELLEAQARYQTDHAARG